MYHWYNTNNPHMGNRDKYYIDNYNITITLRRITGLMILMITITVLSTPLILPYDSSPFRWFWCLSVPLSPDQHRQASYFWLNASYCLISDIHTCIQVYIYIYTHIYTIWHVYTYMQWMCIHNIYIYTYIYLRNLFLFI